MKNQKGLTLITTVLYCTIMLLIIGVVGVIRINTDKNIANIQELKGYVPEINKLSMYMIAETKDSTNAVKKISGDGSSIEFKNGNKYVFTDNEIYKVSSDNKKIKICEEIINCVFEYDMQNRKDIVKVTLQVGRDEIIQKTMEYIFI